ncbi:MAG: lytic murein transglycosylase [Patescibacteria group bacterium]
MNVFSDIRIKKASVVTAVFAVLLTAMMYGYEYPKNAQAKTVGGITDSRRAELEADLANLEKEIAVQQEILSAKQRESVSLERDVAILDAQISEAHLSIKARDLNIQRLVSDIGGKQEIITLLDVKTGREKESLAQLIRKTNEIDSFSLAEVVLSNEDISEFFIDLDSFDSIKVSLQESFAVIEDTKAATTEQKNALEEKRLEEVQLRTIQELQKKRIEEKRSERNKILAATKGQEKAYQKILNEKEKNAAAIRTALFSLQGSAAIPFGKALEYANEVNKKTGVRQAFLLGIIAEESNLGENVGKGTWTVDMHPTRDKPVFADITARLGLDPNVMPVSKKAWYGWGGAMGPAQFIPSTWILYEKRISELTGNRPPNPWNPEDAFMASGVLLKDNGATRGGYSAERLAALRYLAGWKNATKPAYAFYGNDVMELAEKYQKQIDILQGS